jgi:hypothetical protein
MLYYTIKEHVTGDVYGIVKNWALVAEIGFIEVFGT